VALAEGRLFPGGVLEPGGNPPDRLYLPLARESERLGLALARLPGGEIAVADVVRGGPAARAGLRPGMRLATTEGGPEAILARLAAGPGACRIRRDGTAAEFDLRPGERLLGRRSLYVPLLIDWECDQAGFAWAFPLGLVRLSWRQEEAGGGELETQGGLVLLWGLVAL